MIVAPQAAPPSGDGAEPGIEPDYRVRAAALRREKMRARLMQAAMALYQPGRDSNHVVIDDVIAQADVSRGTFYKYFNSVDELVTALGEQLIDEAMRDFQWLFAAEPDAVTRAVGGAAMSLARAWHDPQWGAFTCRINYVDFFNRRTGFDALVRAGLAQAQADGALTLRSLDAAMDLIVGATIEGRRRMVLGPDKPKSYADALLHHLFAGLGLTSERCSALLSTVWLRIDTADPRPHWWTGRAGWY